MSETVVIANMLHIYSADVNLPDKYADLMIEAAERLRYLDKECERLHIKIQALEADVARERGFF